MFNKIFVPLDGSELAERALAPAFTLARNGAAEIVLFQALVPEEIFVTSPTGYQLSELSRSDREQRAFAESYLAEIRERWAGDLVPTRQVVGFGNAAGGIVDTATVEDADLIIMSSHGYSGVTRWLLGSVAEKVLQQAPCPVLVLRNDASIHHIMLTLDGSLLAERAVAPAYELARRLGGRVTLLRVAPDMPLLEEQEAQALEHMEPGLGQRIRNDYYQQAEGYLNIIAHSSEADGVPTRTAVVRGHPAERILRAAEQGAADVIAMATHGRSGLRRWLYGSVTERVLRGATTSLLVVRSPKGELTS